MNWAAALAGAGAAFWLSAALTALFQVPPGYELVKILYGLGLLNPEVAFAGRAGSAPIWWRSAALTAARMNCRGDA